MRGPRRTGGGGGLGAGVPRVRVAVPPRVSPLRPPGSSPWWLHQEPVPALVVGGDVDVFSARLLGGEAPSVDVVGAFLLLVRVRPFLLQLLPFVFRPPVLEPHFHLGESEERTGDLLRAPSEFPLTPAVPIAPFSPPRVATKRSQPCLSFPSPAALRRMGPGAQHPAAVGVPDGHTSCPGVGVAPPAPGPASSPGAPQPSPSPPRANKMGQ